MEEQEQRVKELEQQLVTQKEALMKEQDQRVKVLEQQLEDAAPKDPDALAKVTQGSLLFIQVLTECFSGDRAYSHFGTTALGPQHFFTRSKGNGIGAKREREGT